MTLKIVCDNIVNMQVDAIVNAANHKLMAGGGVCGAIFKAAGYESLTKACQKLSPIHPGEATLTPAYQLKAKYIIHAVGPIYQDGKHGESELLSSAYLQSLLLAKQYHCQSIAFPLISSGIYGYPKDEALSIATHSISEFLLENDMDVYIVVLDRYALKMNHSLQDRINNYIELHYRVDEEILASLCSYKNDELESIKSLEDIDELLNQASETFSEMLFRLIDENGFNDVEVYKGANIDRKLFSKIRSQKDYHPQKKTILSLAISLHLSLDETLDLLNKAGYSLSNSQKSDIIIKYFIENQIYDLFEINNTLFCFDQPILS